MVPHAEFLYIFGISAAGAICLVYVFMEWLLCTPTCITPPSVLVSKERVIPDSVLRSKALKVRHAQVVQMGVAHVQRG